MQDKWECEKKAWTTIAQECIRKYNETEHTVTGFTPIYLLQGTEILSLPKEIIRGKNPSRLKQDRKLALENTRKSHLYNKTFYDKNRKEIEINIEDFVYVENGNRTNRKKLDEIRIGPFKVLERVSNSIYRIDTGYKKTESNLFHISKLITIATI